jgi:signal transduction histidine kinase
MRSITVKSLNARFTLAQGVKFLADEIPVRNRVLAERLQQDASRLTAAPQLAGLQRLLQARELGSADALREHHRAFEACLRALVPELRDLSATDDMATRAAVQRACTFAHHHLISQRVLVAHLAAAGGEASAEPLCAPACDLSALCAATVEEAVLFCREKHGDAPEVVFEAPPARTYGCTVPAYLHFALMEVCKNSLGAHVKRYGVLALCEAPPVRVTLAASADVATIHVSDSGGGLGVEARRRALDFFCTTNAGREANYTYSRAFGSQFDGLGVGLPLAQAHLRYLGGELVLASVAGRGCETFLSLDRSGAQTDPQ